MAKDKTLNPRQVLRYLVFTVLSLFVMVFFLLFLFPAVILPAISGSSLAVHLLAIMPCGLVVGFLIAYLALKLVAPVTEKMPVIGLRQCIVACILGLGYFLTWVLLTFIFETFTPFLPVIVMGILPLYILLMIVVVLSRTRLRDRIEQLLKHLLKENS